MEMHGCLKWMGLVLMGVGILGTLATGSFLLLEGWSTGFGVAFAILLACVVAGFAVNGLGERALRIGDKRQRLVAAQQELPPAFRGILIEALRGAGPAAMPTLADLAARERVPAGPEDAELACGHCGVEGPVVRARLGKVTGLFIAHRHEVLEGSLCRPCVESLAPEFLKHGALAGWWSAHSWIVNLYFLATTASGLAAARRIPPPGRDAAVPELDEATLRRLAPTAGAVTDALARGTPPATLYAMVAERAGTTPGEVALFVAALAGRALVQREIPTARGERPPPSAA